MNNRPEKNWSMLTYIAGDNNLSDEGLKDVSELCEVGASATTHVGVELDTRGECEGSVRYEITEKDWSGESHRVVIERLPEQDSGSPMALANFLRWGFGRCEAKKRLVVVWSHGWGFKSRRRGIVEDESGSSLDMNEVVGALAKAGVSSSNCINILGFDACLMNMVEVASHLAEVAEFLVGSQAPEPGTGWPYDEVLKAMNGNPDVKKLAGQIVEAYIASYDKPPFALTQSAINLDKAKVALDALHTLGNALLEANAEDRDAMLDSRRAVRSFDDYVDIRHLGQLLMKRARDAKVCDACSKLDKAVEDAVLAEASVDEKGKKMQDAYGLSCWFPMRNYWALRPSYTQLINCGSNTGWVKFLDRFVDD